MQERSTHFPSHFYPRPPRGGRPPFLSTRTRCTHFYPRPPRGGRRLCAEQGLDRVPISIHALREEGDRWNRPQQKMMVLFLSTPSARRATRHQHRRPAGLKISIHALREEGDKRVKNVRSHIRNFYPRPPRGGRPISIFGSAMDDIFLSTPSARRATEAAKAAAPVEDISIHALREEGDAANLGLC